MVTTRCFNANFRSIESSEGNRRRSGQRYPGAAAGLDWQQLAQSVLSAALESVTFSG